jgi:hypothetical protein
LREILEGSILRDVLRRQMAVVIDDRKLLGVIEEERLGLFGFEKELIGNKGLWHRRVP